MDKVKGIRQIKEGRWEAAISHQLLPNGRVFRTFEDERSASAYKVLMLSQLEKGVVPSELLRMGIRTNPLPKTDSKKAPVVTIPVAVFRGTTPASDLVEVIKGYTTQTAVKVSDSDLLTAAMLQQRVKGSVEGITTVWADAWIRQMKREEKLAPGTIRKRVECLARVVDWWNRSKYTADSMPANPLRLLPRGYSSYHPGDVPAGEEIPVDTERDRRLEPGEYEAIEQVLMGHKRCDRERPWAPDGDPEMLLLFRLIVATGLRMREAYMLRVENVRFNLRTIHVRASKTGAKRDVPMTRQLEEWLKDQVAGKKALDPVFSFWGGSESKDALRLVTARLSSRFGTLFKYAGCEDLVEHDLRHEATCRWMEMKDRNGGWLFRPEEVRKITGHKSEAMFMRYYSLRGSDLAARLD